MTTFMTSHSVRQVPIEVQYLLIEARNKKLAGDLQGYHAAHIQVANICAGAGRNDVAGNHYGLVAEETQDTSASIEMRYLAVRAFMSAGKPLVARDHVEKALRDCTSMDDIETFYALQTEIQFAVDAIKRERSSSQRQCTKMQIDMF